MTCSSFEACATSDNGFCLFNALCNIFLNCGISCSALHWLNYETMEMIICSEEERGNGMSQNSSSICSFRVERAETISDLHHHRHYPLTMHVRVEPEEGGIKLFLRVLHLSLKNLSVCRPVRRRRLKSYRFPRVCLVTRKMYSWAHQE